MIKKIAKRLLRKPLIWSVEKGIERSFSKTLAHGDLDEKFQYFSFGLFRNMFSWRFDIDARVSSLKLQLLEEKAEILNLNFIEIWARDENKKLYKLSSWRNVCMSSMIESLSDPEAVLQGNSTNTVSIHSKRELNPYWKVEFGSEVDIAFVKVFNRKDKFGVRSRSLSCTVYDATKKIIKSTNRIESEQRNQLLSQELSNNLRSIEACCINENQRSAFQMFRKALLRYIQETNTKRFKSRSNHLRNHIWNMIDTLDWEHEPIGFGEDNAKKISPKGVKYYKLVCFENLTLRTPILRVSSGSSVETIKPNPSHTFNNEIQAAIVDCPWLQAASVFEFKSESIGTHLYLWAEHPQAANILAKHLIFESTDNKTWKLLDDNLRAFRGYSSLLQISEWLNGQRYCERSCWYIGQWASTFRVSNARTLKGQLRGDKTLLAAFMKGIQAGNESVKSLPNVIYTRHGLSVPFSELDQSKLAKRMREFCDLVKSVLGSEPFPCYGTLLGMIRDNAFLPHDDDIDLAIVVEPINNLTDIECADFYRKKLEAAGVKTRFPTANSLNFHCYFSDCDMDLFIMIKRVGTSLVRTHMDRYLLRDIESKLVEPLKKVEFWGFEFSIPERDKAFLKARYGDGWITPDPTFEL